MQATARVALVAALVAGLALVPGCERAALLVGIIAAFALAATAFATGNLALLLGTVGYILVTLTYIASVPEPGRSGEQEDAAAPA